jgi:non-ribosomal peptide synthase protein (TIGR01720 family)
MNEFAKRIAALPPARRQLLDALLQQNRAHHARQEEYAAPRGEVERTLAEIWGLVLGVAHVGIHDSFFDMGGDSIHSIQIIAKARQAGIRFTNTQLFDHPTIASLSPQVSLGHEPSATHAAPAGEIPLTPIQRWFFDQRLTNVHHWNQAVLLRSSWGLADEPTLRAAFQTVVASHDALRVRFERRETAWRQVPAPTAADGIAVAAPAANATDDAVITHTTTAATAVTAAGTGGAAAHARVTAHTAPSDTASFSIVDLASIAADRLDDVIRSIVAAAQRSLDISNGPLIRLVLFRVGDASCRVLLLAHHLVADAVSFRCLLEDLAAQLTGGVAPTATPFAAWARHAHAVAQSDATAADSGFWQRQLEEVPRLPRDFAGGTNLERDARRCTITLDQTETTALRRAQAAIGASVQDILLTALYRAIAGWTQQRRVGVWLEGHGRDAAALDLSRTIGWLTALFPLCLESDPSARTEQILRDVQQAMRAIPARGLGFGLLRYLHRDAAIRDAVAARGPEVLFNYLGVLDTTPAASTADASTPPALVIEDALPDGLYDPDGERPQLLQVYGGIYNGRLVMHWAYSAAFHRPQTIDNCAQAFLTYVRDIARRVSTSPAAELPVAVIEQSVIGQTTISPHDLAAIVAMHERG